MSASGISEPAAAGLRHKRGPPARNVGVTKKDFAAAFQGDFRFVRLNQNMSEHFAADAEHWIIKDAFLGSLADVTREADDKHDIDGGLVIANDDGGFREGFARDILEFEFSKRHPFHDPARN